MRLHPFRGRPARAALLATGVVVASTFLLVTPAQALPDERIGYGFEAGAGTAVADSSSNSTPATATGPTWTAAGRFGNAITFNGSSTRVRSNAEITLNGAFTLEAYVFNPTNQAYETVVTVGSDRDVYLQNGTLNLWTGSANLAFGPALATSTWQHVAIVSDGAAVRAYVDGVQRGTTQTASLGSSTGSLQVGSWIEESGTNTDFLSGTLDEVRAYNRALSATEIGTDRDTAVINDTTTGGGGTDTTPPTLSGAQPTGTLAAGTTQTTLQATTNEAATCRYSTTPGTAYAAMTTTFATTAGTAHSTPITGLTNGTNYSFSVRCQDTAGNPTTTDFPITFAVGTGAASQLGSWSTTAALPSGRSGNGAVAVNGYMYLVGGLDASGSVVTTVNYARINTDGTLGTWGTTTQLPQPTRSVRPVYANGYIYIVAGGPTNSSYYTAIYRAPVADDGTLGAWLLTGQFPQAQLSHAVVANGGYLYVIGGNPGTCINTVRYAAINADGSLGTWTTTSALPAPRCGIVEAATVANGRIYTAAGFDNSDVTNRVFYATINANGSLGAWTNNATTLTNAREYTAVESVGGYLFVLGGQAAYNGNVTTSVEQAPINTDGSVGTFTAATPLPAPRGYLASEAVNGRIYLLGGGTAISGGTPQPTVYVADGPGAGSAGDTTPPVRSGGAPTGALAAGTTQATLQVTTNEAATCRYSTVAGTAFTAMTSTFATTGGTAHSSPVTGLTAGSYTYYVRCRDAAQNADTADYPITFTIAAAGGTDTTAPTVSLSAPAAGATVSGSVAVTATAADNVGVAGVQFVLDGAALDAEDTSAPYSVTWATTTATNGTHTVAARARDAAGNQTTSTAVTVTVSNSTTGTTGAQAAYPFSAGSGTAITDASGTGTTATATSPTWTTAGQYGSAITYNGSTTRVRSNADITLGSAFTVEMWLNNPTNQDYETLAAVGASRDIYLNNGILNYYYNGSQNVTFGAALATGTWTHVALVSDGTTVRAYVDGVQRGSTTTLAGSTATAPLQIGSWNSGANNYDFFSGTIDEVRVYNRALTATEIATDRDTPIT